MKRFSTVGGTVLAVGLLGMTLAAEVFAQAPTPAPAPAATPAAAPAPTPPGARLVSSIRNKISAADLRSAESLAEVYREQQSDDGSYLLGLSWIARGALMLGEPETARDYIAEVRKRCDARMAKGIHTDQDDSLEIALGAAIEVEAQLRAREKGKADAMRFLDAELAKVSAPVSMRSRIHKRMNFLSLEGKPAPEITVEDHAGSVAPPSLASLRGKPVMIYVWDKGCGDCRGQAGVMSRVVAKHAKDGLVVYPVTRYYVKENFEREKARLDSVWTAEYSPIGPAPLAISTAAMETYGGSSTPTFVFVDRKGIVRSYLPYRLTEEAFDAEIAKILK